MAAAVKTLSVAEQIQQLNEARKIVLENASYYDRIVKGILPIIGPTSPVELRRWGAEFLAESLSTPVLNSRDKENLTVAILDTLRLLLESQGEDPLVLKASIIAAASAYPIAMRWIIHNSYHKESWDAMTAIKARILRIWDGAASPVKVCCVKFAQRVVLAQTASNGMEYKTNGLDVSLAMVPPNHPLLDHRLLEAEAAGLLDRMLAVLQDNSSDALLVDATLNCLSILVRSRPSTSNRIMNTVLGFNPLKLANSPMTPTTKVLIKSMEKTTRMLLIHLLKRDPSNALAPRIQQHVERLMRSRAEIFDDSNRKRAYGPPPANEYDNAKRQKVNGDPQQVAPVQAWTPGPQSLAAVFSLTNIMGLQGFDATQVPAALTAKINTKCLASMSPQVLDHAVNTIRTRLATLYALAPPVQPPVLNPDTSPLGVDEDEDDYEPDFYAAEDNEQILNKLDSAPTDKSLVRGPTDVALAPLGPFKLPSPPLVDSQVAAKVGQATSSRVFAPLPSLEEGALRKPKAGINRLAASTYDRDSWLTLITRLATRSAIEDASRSISIKGEDGAVTAATRATTTPHLSNMIRELLYNYVLEDWRRRIEVAVAWLCEEWYNDQLTKRAGTGAPLHYERWALRLVDGFLSYITAQDKVLTRFLAEIPELSRPLLGRLKALCGDPTKVQLALTSLLYLVMMRPPVREVALDTVAGIWMEYEDARPLASKYLVKWRPGFIESQQQIKAQ